MFKLRCVSVTNDSLKHSLGTTFAARSVDNAADSDWFHAAGKTSQAVEQMALHDRYREEMKSLSKIIIIDQGIVYANGGSRVGLILGLILVAGLVITAFHHINKNKNTISDDYDEGGLAENDDDY